LGQRKLGSFWVCFGFVFPEPESAVYCHNPLLNRRLSSFLAFRKLGSFGFVLGLSFSSWAGWFIIVILCDKGGCIDFVLLRFGFVLHKKGAICRVLSTNVESRRQNTGDRRQKAEDRFAMDWKSRVGGMGGLIWGGGSHGQSGKWKIGESRRCPRKGPDGL